MTHGHPALHRRRRKPFKVGHLFKLQGQGPRRDRPRRAGRHRRRGQGGRDPVRLRAARLARRGPDPPEAAGVSRRRCRASRCRRRSAADEQQISDRAAQADRRGPDDRARAQPGRQRDGAAGAGRAAPARDARADEGSRYKCEIDTRPPRIAYRETISAKADGYHRHKKQTGGAGQFGEVFLRIEPLPRGGGFEFVDAVKGGVDSAPVHAGRARRASSRCSRPARSRVTRCRTCGWSSRRQAPPGRLEGGRVRVGGNARPSWTRWPKARPMVLEPMVSVEIICPEANTGDIAGDLSSRRGQVTGTNGLGPGVLAVSGLAPLVELDGYSARLKSVTGGHGSFTMALSHYEPAARRTSAAADHRLRQAPQARRRLTSGIGVRSNFGQRPAVPRRPRGPQPVAIVHETCGFIDHPSG